MKASAFVCASAVLFATWLMVTYVHEVSPKDYPTLGRGSVPLSAQRVVPVTHSSAMISLQEETELPVADRKTPTDQPPALSH